MWRNEQMAGAEFPPSTVAHAVWEAGKLFHIDLKRPGPWPLLPGFRFGAANVKVRLLVVMKFLEDVGYAGPRAFRRAMPTAPKTTNCAATSTADDA